MLLSRSATLIALASIGLAFPHRASEAFAQETHEERRAKEMAALDPPPVGCHVTLASEGSFAPPSPVPLQLAANQFWFGTERLWTRLPTDGIWRGSVPRKRGDFAYGDKSFWLRGYPGFTEKDAWLTITGKRLDGPAPSFTETYHHYASERDDDSAMIVGGIAIPVFGCWRVTGRYKDQELSFTVWVTPLPEQKLPSGEFSRTIPEARPTVETAHRRIHIDGETQARSLVYRVTPEIPHGAQVASVSGTVVLQAIITTEGRASELTYISGPPLLVQAAINAVQWWRYQVATTRDQPNEALEVETTIQVVFLPARN